MSQPHDERRAIDMSAVYEALEQPLSLVDSPEKRADMQRYIDLARLHLERAVFDVVAKTVQVVNDADGNVRAHLEYEEASLAIVVRPTRLDTDDSETEALFSVDGDVEKVTIRIPSELKELVGEAASSKGVSVNTWYIRELAAAVKNAASRTGRDAIRDIADEARGRSGHQRHHGGGSLRGIVGDD